MSGKYWDVSWNPVVGCTPASAGCKHCYAERLHNNRHAAWIDNLDMPDCYSEPFSVIRELPERMEQPIRWSKPRVIFVCNMSDLFHNAARPSFIADVLSVAERSPRHTFLFCTKRPINMFWKLDRCDFNKFRNCYFGVTMESQREADARMPVLRQIAVRGFRTWVSVEPMLGYVYLGLPHVPDKERPKWIVCGGESGPGARKMELEFASNLSEQANMYSIPFYMKQWGDAQKGLASQPQYAMRKDVPWRVTP